MDFYHNLLKFIPGREFSEANLSLCTVKPVDAEDKSFNNIISYIWQIKNDYRLIVVNYSLNFSKAHIIIEGLEYGLSNWRFIDVLEQKSYTYKGEDLDEHGLYIELNPWRGQIFEIEKF
jgi:hypothetical protein